MTELLRQVVAKIELLPADEQDAIAGALQRNLADREWDNLFASPASDRFLSELADDIEREIGAGTTKTSGDHW